MIQRFGLFLLKTVANKILKMNCETKSIYLEVVNVISLEIILSLMKYKGLSYPTHFLKIAGSGIGDNFLEYSLKKVTIFALRIVSHTFSLQMKQILYSIGTDSAPEATQILAKM